MHQSLFDGVSSKARAAFWIMTVGAIGVPMALIAAFVRPEPMARELVYGCYRAEGAPALAVKDDVIRIVEPERRSIHFEVEPSKDGYQLHVNPALQLSPQLNGSYAYKQVRGVGFFWPLLPRADKSHDRMRHPTEYAGRFRAVATDGREVVYTRTPERDCFNVR